MSNNKEYWSKRNEMAAKAQQHTKEMEEKCDFQIRHSIAETVLYGVNGVDPVSRGQRDGSEKTITPPINIIMDADTVTAAFTMHKLHPDMKIGILNFASYKEPGGMFIQGSKAQEECICHESALYNVLRGYENRNKDYYSWNNQHKNRALYMDRGLYSPNVPFMKTWEDGSQSETTFDVVTVAAPNKSAAQEYQKVPDAENTRALRSRIKFVLDIADAQRISIMVLGAFGCGVFGQDPHEVATIFQECLLKSNLQYAVFAIPDGKNGNLKAFKEVFG